VRPCKKEIPELTAAHDKYAKKGLVVVGIALDDKVEATRDFAKAYEMRYTACSPRKAASP
jgi:peroxiredoxin